MNNKPNIKPLLSTLQDLQDLVILINCEQVGRVVTMTFQRGNERWSEQFLTMIGAE